MSSTSTIRSIVLLFLLGSLVFARPAVNNSLVVTITNLKSNQGHVLVSLFKSEEGFPDNPAKSFQNRQALITNKQSTIEFSSLPEGNYAIAVLHDENDDRKMNKNWLGIPKEGYGFSNNVMGTLGPPSFSKASFSIGQTGDNAISIRLRY